MIIWLSSYPKSGNTWLRSIIASLLYTNDGVFDFSLIKKIKQFPSRKTFKDFTENFNNINKIQKPNRSFMLYFIKNTNFFN